MKLKSLEILGFKSFKDKTVFNFSGGISAIVGPNGCGKSNVVDAIRWVMGEQRVKTLRGKKMEDVIFNGSEGVSPVGMAEVSIILEKNGRSFTGKYADCSEVMVSRRIFREGESEYYINKVPCRLLDIREFFMDMGIGARTYSIVEQESISRLIEAKPEDIREFIEDAAGIKKYKSRKESATRKMESTRLNIARLKDIMKEIKNQMNSTSRQAKRAERYKTLRRSIKETELTLSLQAYLELTSKIKTLKSSYDSLNENSIQAATNLQLLEVAAEDTKSELITNEGSLAKFQEEFYNAKNEINIGEQKITFLKGKIADIKARKETNLLEIEASRNRKEMMEEEIAALKTSIIELDDKITGVEDSIAANQEQVSQLKDMEAKLAGDLEREKSAHFHIATEHARLTNMHTSLTRRIDDLKRKAVREARDLDENTEKLKSRRDTLSILETDLQSNIISIASLKEKENITQRNIEKSRNTLEMIDKEIAHIKEQIGANTSRLTSLREFQEGYEGCNEGTKSVLKAKKRGTLPDGEIYGLVADHINVPKEYELAVEAVLGEKLQYIVVKSQEDGIKAINYLKNHSSGRGNFVPLEVRNNLSNSQSLGYLKGVVKLGDFVQSKEDVRKIIESLLGDVLLVPDLYAGVSLWRQNGFIGTFVTPEGDLISPDGVLTGGSGMNGRNSLLRNKREITRLEQDINQLSSLLANKTEAKKKTSSIVSQTSNELDELRSDIRQSELDLNSKKKDIERLEGEIQWIEQRTNVLRFNKESLESEERKARENRKHVEKEIASYENKEKDAAMLISSLQENWRKIKTDLEEGERILTEKKILITSLEERKSSNIGALERLNNAISDLINEMESNILDTQTSETEVANVMNCINEEQENLKHLYKNHNSIERELAKLRELRSVQEGVLREKEAEAREVKRGLDNLTKDLNKLDMEIQELTVHVDNLKRGVHEKFHVDLEVLLPKFNKLNEEDVEELKNALDRNKKMIEDFGEVNLLALTEHEELKKRYEFFAVQIEDLNTSLDTLQKTITRMNRISKKRFSETFEAINQCFDQVFPKLFPGGKGRLRLTDESDMLETGVDIDVQIPGKKRQNISLLSGGEKALSAVALIFAILMHRPSPFLIFDEVDAALDDSNVSLFKKLLDEISLNSQIIFVTHNKNTMESADNLFGITMEKHGISSTVAVSLN